MSQKVRAIIFRSCERREITFATVSVRHTRNVQRSDQLFSLFQKAVTEWVKTTEEGKKAYDDSAEDFNVGDLSEYYTSDEFRDIAENHGLIEIEIDITSESDVERNWTYDNHLVNSLEVDDETD